MKTRECFDERDVAGGDIPAEEESKYRTITWDRCDLMRRIIRNVKDPEHIDRRQLTKILGPRRGQGKYKSRLDDFIGDWEFELEVWKEEKEMSTFDPNDMDEPFPRMPVGTDQLSISREHPLIKIQDKNNTEHNSFNNNPTADDYSQTFMSDKDWQDFEDIQSRFAQWRSSLNKEVTMTLCPDDIINEEQFACSKTSAVDAFRGGTCRQHRQLEGEVAR